MNTFGNALTVTLFGESHGSHIGAVVDGISPGIKIDTDYIDKKLALRRPNGKTSTARVEADKYQLISGVFNGYTTGAPLTLIIPNENTDSKAITRICQDQAMPITAQNANITAFRTIAEAVIFRAE